jgi:Flp pilus assembly protein TadG
MRIRQDGLFSEMSGDEIMTSSTVKKPSRGFMHRRRSREKGQAALFLLLSLGLFLVAAAGLAVDMSDLWMHRQASQNAADAACTAAAMDLVNSANGAANTSGFTPGTAFNCSSNPGAAPCQYAGFNGYTATGLTAGSPSTEVAISFPSSVAGVQTCSATNPPPSICTETGFPANAFVRATVTDRIQTFLVGLLSGGRTMDVGATAACGAILSNAPIPILVLNPSISSSLSGNGTEQITIVGGPQRSIQVDSSNSAAARFVGSGTIDLSHGGPNNSGSDIGITGSETQSSAGATVNWGTLPGQWLDPRSAISDPFATIPAPSSTGMVAGTVTYGQKAFPECSDGTCGCPDLTDGCDHYHPGTYAGITVNTGAATGLAIFDPGIYYLTGDLTADSNTCMRPSTATGDGSGGTMFYFSGLHTLNVTSNSGNLKFGAASSPRFDCQSTTWKVPLTQVVCIPTGSTGATILPTNVINAGGLVGNVLLASCQTPTVTSLCTPNCSINYGDPLGANDPLGEQRGMLFFQDRSADLASSHPPKQPSWQGGGSFGLAGNLYFHYCNSATAGSGGGCPTSAFTDQFSLGGGSSTNTFVVGDIVTDELSLGGNSQIEMDLNPNALYYVLKASLLQ